MTANRGSTLTITYPSPAELRIQREFAAPRQLVWDAHTQPELLGQWLLGPDGWSMPQCLFEPQTGGAYRYEWRRDATGETMAMGGTITEWSPIARFVATERFDEAWYPGEAVNTAVFEEIAPGRTRLTVTTRYESAEALQTAMQTGMVDGMAATYDRLAAMLAEIDRGAPAE